MSDQRIQDTTDLLFTTVDRVLSIAEIDEARLVQSAVLIYQVIDEDGNPTVDYVVSNTLGLTSIIGLADFLREAAIRALFKDGE